jgi:hypothetical protein
MPIACSGATTNINRISTPVSTVSSESLRSLRKWRKSLMKSGNIASFSDYEEPIYSWRLNTSLLFEKKGQGVIAGC